MKKHGHAVHYKVTPTYASWKKMKGRCLQPGATGYSNYGGRGITVCDRWLSSFENFLADMGERPTGLTLDRIDTNGNYDVNNCQWSTRAQQGRSRRTTHLTEYLARLIKALQRHGMGTTEISRLLSLPYGAVNGLMSGYSWKDIP